MSASVGTTRRIVPSEKRLAPAATAIARTGGVAPLMRWRGDCSPVSRKTPVSSDRNASDGAVDIPCAAESIQPSFLLSHTRDQLRRRIAFSQWNADDPAASGL